MKFDEILSKIGEFGNYQKMIYTFLAFPCASVGCFSMMLIVVLYTPEHRCKIPSLSNDTYTVQSAYHELLINETIPNSIDASTVYDRCHMYDTLGATFDADNRPVNASLVQCKEWVYDKSVFTNTFTAQINLVCDDSLKTSHVMMSFYFGVLVGDIVLGMLSDSIGRLKAMCISFIILLGSSVTATFAPELYSFASLEFVIGGSCHAAFVAIAVISMEMVGPSKRIWTGMLIQAFYSVGVCYITLIGFLTRSWTWVNLATAIPCAFYLTYWWFIPESPRWLISKGRKKDAIKIIRRTAKFNKARVPEDAYDLDEDIAPTSGNLWQLFRSPVLLCRILIMSFNWMIVSMTFYGVTMNAGNMGGSFFRNLLLMALVEIPGIFIAMAILDRIGRRWSNAGTMIVGGIACVATIPAVVFGGDDLQPLTIALALVGKSAASGAFAIVYMFTAELFPTVVRNAAMGTCSCAARVGAMLAPYIAKSGEMIGGNFGMIEPLVVFGVLSIAAGLLLFLLPETLNQKLPDTIAEGEEFGRKLSPKEQEIEMPFMVQDKDITDGQGRL